MSAESRRVFFIEGRLADDGDVVVEYEVDDNVNGEVLLEVVKSFHDDLAADMLGGEPASPGWGKA